MDAAIDGILRQIEDIRLELFRIKRLLREHRDTPIRPPSQAAMEAFRQSAEFLEKKPR